jgi:excisionase family DNA binding protein
MGPVLTTFEIANLCGVDITTVINWVESGKLPAYKTPGGHRRVRREEFLRFLKAYQLPVPRGLGGVGQSILIAHRDAGMRASLSELLMNRWPAADIVPAADSFTAGKLLAEKHPSIILLDFELPGIDCEQACRIVRDDRRLRSSRIVVVVPLIALPSQEGLREAGADDVVSTPLDPDALLRVIERIFPDEELQVAVEQA